MIKLSYSGGNIILRLLVNIIDQNVLHNIEIFSNACLTVLGSTYNGHSTDGHWSVEKSKHINVP